jgi:hypothetical protein
MRAAVLIILAMCLPSGTEIMRDCVKGSNPEGVLPWLP